MPVNALQIEGHIFEGVRVLILERRALWSKRPSRHTMIPCCGGGAEGIADPDPESAIPRTMRSRVLDQAGVAGSA